jgi:hypothetical protein
MRKKRIRRLLIWIQITPGKEVEKGLVRGLNRRRN